MLILCSNGLSSSSLLDRISPFTKESKTAAIVVTADNVYKERNYHVPRCVDELEQLGLSVETFDLDTKPAALLQNYDVVEFIGGNPYYLLHAIRAQGCESILAEIAKTKLLIGWSAAVFVFGPTLELVDQYTPEMNFLKLKDLTGIALTKLHILPHYSKFLLKFNSFEETCHHFEIERGTSVLRINDGDGVIINGDTFELVLV